MKRKKTTSLLASLLMVIQSLAPLSYAQGGGGDDGPTQPVAPISAPGSDPADAIVPDTYVDLPTVHPGLSTTSTNDDYGWMWTQATNDFYNSIDFSLPPKDPELWLPVPMPPINRGIRVIHDPLPWETGGGGSISNGDGMIKPPIGPGNGGGGGGGGNGGGSRGEVSGQMNTNTGMMNLQVPIVSFSGPGQGNVDLSLQLKSFTANWLGKLWTDNYDIRLDVSRQVGIATVTMPSGFTMPFTRVGPAPPPGTVGGEVYAGPMGIRANLVNVNGLGYQLQWRNGDVWFFGGTGNQGAASYVTYISYRRGGSVGIQRTSLTTTISTGERSVTISLAGAPGVPSGLDARILGPNGITDISSTPANSAAERQLFVSRPGNSKVTTLYFMPVTQITGTAGGGGIRTISGTKFTGYRDAKQTALNSNLRYTYSYDSMGRVVVISNPAGKSVQYSYAIPGQTKITNEDGKVSWDYYSNGDYIGGKDEANFTTVVGRNAEHDVISYRNERLKTWSITRSPVGDAVSITNPLNETISFSYSAYGDTLSKTDALTHTTQFFYDNQSRLTSVQNALGHTVFTATYDNHGQPLTVKDALDRTTSMTYYTNGDLASTTSPEGLTSTVVYNALGQPTHATAPGNRTTQIFYDVLSRPYRIKDPNNGNTWITYDLNDNVVEVKDPLQRASTMTYDILDQLITSTNPRLDTESYTYTALGQVKTITNGRGKVRGHQYTDRGELKYSYLPDGTTEFYDYFGDGSTAAFYGSGRSKVNYAYDPTGRLSIIDYLNMGDTSFTYDQAGRKISMSDTSGVTSWFYDDANRLTLLNQAGKVTSYEYNNAGQRTKLVQPAGNTTYNYDGFGRLTGLTNPFGEATAFGYDPLGRLATKHFVSGQYEHYIYDNLDRLESMAVKTNLGAFLRTESYTYNAASEVTSHTVDNATTSYSYDEASQLIGELRPGYNATYTFDRNGNRLTKTLNGVTESYTYDNGDKMLTAGNKTYQYDPAGRTTQILSWGQSPTTFTYDDEDRVKTLSGALGNQTYTYNGFDTRVTKQAFGNTVEYHRDGAGVTAPLIANTGATYTPGVSERRNGTTTFSHSALKDNTSQSGMSQTLTATRQYDAYGALLSQTGPWKGPFGYSGSAGYQEDETGLQLLGHRYYDPSTGRFLTRDPIKDGRNWYAYCENNPVSRVDADGLKSATAAALGHGILLRIMQLSPWLRDRLLALLGLSVQQANQWLQRGQQLQKATFELADEAADFVGKRGGALHRNTVNAFEQSIRRPGINHVSGGSLPERITRTGGVKDRYADIVYEVVDTGSKIAVQIGKQLKDGRPCSRERQAIADLIKSGDFDDVIFIPYNVPYKLMR